MNCTIICVGKLKESYWRDAAAEYLKRLGRFGKISVIELPESKTDNKDEESDLICEKLNSLSGFVIALDVGGKKYSSEAFADKISKLGISGESHLIFVIGGSNGFNDKVRTIANERLSFSDFTFPHQLMRVVLLEQVYRAFKINSGEKYHK